MTILKFISHIFRQRKTNGILFLSRYEQCFFNSYQLKQHLHHFQIHTAASWLLLINDRLGQLFCYCEFLKERQVINEKSPMIGVYASIFKIVAILAQYSKYRQLFHSSCYESLFLIMNFMLGFTGANARLFWLSRRSLLQV